VHALSEIAHNVKEGVVSIAQKVKNSKIVKILADKKAKLKEKKKVLCTTLAPIVVQVILTAVVEVLKLLCNG